LIAYVFWHHRRPAVPAAEYENALLGFHQSLLAHPPVGLERTTIFRIAEVPWLASDAPVYEDWHLLSDSSALDLLNEAAVSGARLQPHNRVAALAGGGTAGLYSLRLGRPSPSPPALAYWFSKPEGMPYATFFDTFRSHCSDGATLWGRQMVLGPTPEFCLHASHEVTIPQPTRVIRLVSVFDREALRPS
jgi:hypothetical protein